MFGRRAQPQEEKMRVSFDLDEVLFVSPDTHKTEPPLKFPLDRIFRERLRLGTPDVIRTLQEITDLLNTKYASTIHIDNSMLLRTFSGSKECDVYALSGSPETWSREALDAFEKMCRKDAASRK